jgi:hypothetical protein
LHGGEFPFSIDKKMVLPSKQGDRIGRIFASLVICSLFAVFLKTEGIPSKIFWPLFHRNGNVFGHI